MMDNSVFPDYRLEGALLLANATIFFWYSGTIAGLQSSARERDYYGEEQRDSSGA